MAYLKNCYTCGNKPVLETRVFGRSMSDDTQVTHHMYVCRNCTEKYKDVDGGCYQTFEWESKSTASEEWNDIVKNNNSWYTKEYQQKIQTKLF